MEDGVGEARLKDERVKRGEITRVTFTATKPVLYPITCTKHPPNMQGTLVVLPK